MAKKFSTGAAISIAVKLLTLDLSARLVDAIPNIPPVVKGLVGISVALARFPILKRLTRGMPFGLSGIVTAVMTLSAAQIVISNIPNLIQGLQSFGAQPVTQRPALGATRTAFGGGNIVPTVVRTFAPTTGTTFPRLAGTSTGF